MASDLAERPAMGRLTIPKLKFSEPRHNLPGRKGTASPEDRFTISFARAYAKRFQKRARGAGGSEIALAREIPVNGYGIADLIAVSWNKPQVALSEVDEFLVGAKAKSIAFECKLDDWRKAMSQATRYRFFAHQAIVVVPASVWMRALPYLDTFRKIRVGLWAYDAGSSRIVSYHTPRPKFPKSRRYYLHSVKMVQKAARKALPIQ